MNHQYLAAMLAITSVPMSAQVTTTPAFDVASVKVSPPMASGAFRVATMTGHGNVTFVGSTLKNLIRWLLSEGVPGFGSGLAGYRKVDIIAKTASTVSDDELKIMLQTLLAERFKLRVHKDSKVVPVYALVIGKSGPKIHEVQADGGAKYFPGKSGISAE